MKKIDLSRILAYLFVPVFFSVLGYGILTAALKPVWELTSALVSMVTTEEMPDFQPQLTSVFDPESAARTPVQMPQTEDAPEAPYIRIQDIQMPDDGAHYANLSCQRIGLDAPVYWDDTSQILRSGVGHYLASTFPGFGGMIVLSAHNTTWFKPLQNVAVGDVFHYDTNYGNYEYEVVNVEVLDENELLRRMMSEILAEKEQLIMYTCYPFGPHVGRKTDRFTVTARRISGYDVRWKESQYD